MTATTCLLMVVRLHAKSTQAGPAPLATRACAQKSVGTGWTSTSTPVMTGITCTWTGAPPPVQSMLISSVEAEALGPGTTALKFF